MSESKEDALRKKNMATLDKFFNFHVAGTTREERIKLFADEAVMQTGFAEPPEQTVGIEAIRKRFHMLAKYFKDYKYYNVKINSTQDPNKFFVEEGGFGIILKPGAPPLTPKAPNPHINLMIMEDGKIKLWREYFDQLYAMKLLGVEVPEFLPLG